MRFASSISAARDAVRAVDELLEPIDTRVTPGMVDLVLLFSTAHFEDELEGVVDRIQTAFPKAVIIGCTAEGTIGCDQELERVPSMSMIVGSMPNVEIRPFHMGQAELQAATSLFAWERLVGVSPENKPTFVALADPFRVDLSGFIGRVNDLYPTSVLVGGVAGAAQEPGQNRLIVGGEIYREGIVGVALTGQLKVDTVVSQGCRPIGRPFVITKGERNVVYELGGKAALEALHDVMVDLSDEESRLARQALFVGRVIDEHKDRFTRGDFLIRNIIGVDKVHGAIGIAGQTRVGSTVQFHVRDAASADEDLRVMLAPHARRDVRGAVLFGCNGRGTNMWPVAGHDVGVFRELFTGVPVAGCFCGGEFGPVSDTNFIHAFTASLALFSEPTDD